MAGLLYVSPTLQCRFPFAKSFIAIHGDKQQNERDWVLNEFKTGKSPIMVATDVASRGIGMIDHRNSQHPAPVSSSHHVALFLPSRALCDHLANSTYLPVQAFHDLFWLLVQKFLSVLCSVVLDFSYSVSRCAMWARGGLEFPCLNQATCPWISQDHYEFAMPWTWICESSYRCREPHINLCNWRLLHMAALRISCVFY